MSKALLWRSDHGDGSYNNPILFADYSDPDVIRVGNTYYMTASSFNYTPGLPILTSTDLVNWSLKNYAITNLPDKRFEVPAHSEGVWAPSIRYHNHLFWIFYGMPDEGIYMIKTSDPLDKWSEPYLLMPGKGYIDPCPFWDDDGRAYMIHGYAKSRIGFKSILGLVEISPDGQSIIEEDTFIYDGNKTQSTIEGPKVYKKNDWYYIFAPAGGVTNGWQTVLRSKSLHGPYEERIVMAQRDTEINGPHQGAMVETPDGQGWFVHFQDRGIYGRVTHLQPLSWQADDWPLIGIDPDANACGKPILMGEKPKTGAPSSPTYLEASDDFDKPSLGLQWQWMGNHHDNFYSLELDVMKLRLNCLNPSGDKHPLLWRSANVLTQKIICPSFEVLTKLHIGKLKNNEQTGIVITGATYAYLAVRKDGLGLSLVYVEAKDEGDGMVEKVYHRHALDQEVASIVLRLTLAHNHGHDSVSMAWSEDGEDFLSTGHSFIPNSDAWVGAKVGLFALALDNEAMHGCSEIDYFEVMGKSYE